MPAHEPRSARRTRPAGDEKRERILGAALELFAAHGFRGTSLDAVAAAVGITRQGVLYYFPTKTHLLLGVLDLRDQEERARAEEGDHSTAFVAGLLASVRHNQQAPELPRLRTVLAADSVHPDHPGHEYFRERYRQVRTVLAYAIKGAQETEQLTPALAPPRLAPVLAATMDGLQLQYLLDPDSVDMVEPLADLLALLADTSP